MEKRLRADKIYQDAIESIAVRELGAKATPEEIELKKDEIMARGIAKSASKYQQQKNDYVIGSSDPKISSSNERQWITKDGTIKGKLYGVRDEVDPKILIEETFVEKDKAGHLVLTWTEIKEVPYSKNFGVLEGETKGYWGKWKAEHETNHPPYFSEAEKKVGAGTTKTEKKYADDDVVKIKIAGKEYRQTAKALRAKGYNDSQFYK